MYLEISTVIQLMLYHDLRLRLHQFKGCDLKSMKMQHRFLFQTYVQQFKFNPSMFSNDLLLSSFPILGMIKN